MKKRSKKTIILGIFFLSLQALTQVLFAKDWDPRLIQANELAFAGRANQAMTIIESYLKDNPKDPNGYMVKSAVMGWKMELEDRPKAYQYKILEVLKKANFYALHQWDKDQDNPEKMINLGTSYFLLGAKYGELDKYKDAVLTAKKCQKHLKRALKKLPHRTDALYSMGLFHYIVANLPPKARPFKGILGLSGTKPQAFAELKKASQTQHPYAANALHVQYTIYRFFEKDMQKAHHFAGQLLKKYPNNPQYYYSLAVVSEEKQPARALKDYQNLARFCKKSSARCHPVFPFLAHHNSGRMYEKLGKHRRAVAEFVTAAKYQVDRPGHYAENYFRMAFNYQKMKSYKKANASYKKALAIKKIRPEQKKRFNETLTKMCQVQTQAC